MRAVIVGCGRVGATMAQVLDTTGHEVTIVDLLTRSFDRLPATFRGNAVRGDGTDEDTLRRAGAEGADLFLALTEGDNRNIMAAQLALEALGIRPRLRQGERSRAGAGLCGAGDRDDLPDDDDGRRAARRAGRAGQRGALHSRGAPGHHVTRARSAEPAATAPAGEG